jgi:hypothetical protein
LQGGELDMYNRFFIKVASYVVLVTSTIFVGCGDKSSPVLSLSANVTPYPPKVNLSCNEGWDSTIRPLLEQRLRNSKLEPLSNKSVNPEIMAFRMWVGFGSRNVRGFIYEVEDSGYSAMYLSENPVTENFTVQSLREPAGGWSQLKISALVERQCENPVMTYGEDDADLIVIEVRANNQYRVNIYDPTNKMDNSSKQAIQIAELIESKFNISLLTTK